MAHLPHVDRIGCDFEFYALCLWIECGYILLSIVMYEDMCERGEELVLYGKRTVNSIISDRDPRGYYEPEFIHVS